MRRIRPARKSNGGSLQRNLLALAVTQAIFGASGHAATINVDSLLDDDGTGCTLREAVASANATLDPANGCAYDALEDTITFAGLTGTIILTNGQLPISSAMTIQGPGADQLTIDAAMASRHFQISSYVYGATTPKIAVTIDGLTLVNGNANGGGAISNSENLTLINSTLSGNSSSFRGGGLSNSYDATVTLSNTTLSGNSAPLGGGISSGGTVTVTNSTLSDNTAALQGGGIFSVYPGTLTLTNSTLSGNSGGGISNAGTMRLTNSTVMDSTGTGLYNSSSEGFAGVVHLFNSVIANSTLGDCSDVVPLTTNVNNLIADGSCYNASNLSGDPVLGPLQNNGGSTDTHAVLTGSPVINAGDQNACNTDSITTDQRGYLRDDGACDIGAFEFNAMPPPDLIFSDGFEPP